MRSFPQAVVLAAAFIVQAASGQEAVPGGTAAPPKAPETAQAPGTASPSLAELLARSQELSRSGKPVEAYELLSAAEDAHIGTIEFDYALGRAALDAGRPDKATLAFARVLALDPNHAGASIDMGRAYLALGDFARARTMFQGLLALDPPPEVRAQLLGFLDLANARGVAPAASPGLAYQGFLALMAGRSSNVNQSPSQSEVFVPVLGSNFQLADQNVKKADGFAGAMGGINLSQSLNRTYSVIFGGEFLERRNFHESDFDLAGLSAYLGLAATTGPHAWRIQALRGRDYLGRDPSRDLTGLALNYVGTLSTETQFLGLAQQGRLRYLPEGLRSFNANYVALGAGAAHRVGDRSTVFGVFSTGKQDDVGGNIDGNQDLLGVRIGGETAIGSRVKATATAAGEWGRYDKLNTGFGVERRDFRQTYEARLDYWLDRAWSLRLGFLHAHQGSNIPIYPYTKNEWLLMLRREFQ
jgi:outer membrane protein